MFVTRFNRNQIPVGGLDVEEGSEEKGRKGRGGGGKEGERERPSYLIGFWFPASFCLPGVFPLSSFGLLLLKGEGGRCRREEDEFQSGPVQFERVEFE